jgi:hypothetical protein
MLDPDSDLDEMNTDLQPCVQELIHPHVRANQRERGSETTAELPCDESQKPVP